MKKSLCLILSCCMFFCGCADNYHHSDHCDEFSADRINLTPEERKNYIPILTPTTDVATECYCYTEDAIIVTGYGVLIGALCFGAMVSGYGYQLYP